MRDNCRWKREEILGTSASDGGYIFAARETRGAKKDTGRQIDTY